MPELPPISAGSFHGKDLHLSFGKQIAAFSASPELFGPYHGLFPSRHIFRFPNQLIDGWVNAYRLESKFVLIFGIWNPSNYFRFCNMCAYSK
jgi:hypothetical protein